MKTPTITPAPARRIRKRKSIATTTPLSPLAIASVSEISFDGANGSLVVTFDVNEGYSLLDPVGLADPTQWSVIYNHVGYSGTSFMFDGGNQLTIFFADQFGAFIPPSISYAASPSDIGDTQGRMLGEVDGYPI